MYVSARDRFILDLLIQQPEGVTIREIAHSLQVSERTIHRDLTSFDSLLHPYEITLEKITGKGIFLKGSKEQIDQFTQDLQEAKHFDFLPEQRYVIIICKLLESFEPMKLQSLATDLNVTVATISNDLDKVAEWLLKYELTLEKRRGFGIQLVGNESSKRKAISGLLAENFDETDILQYIRRQLPSQETDLSESIAGQLLGFINVEKLKKVEVAVEKICRSLDYQIADSAYIALVVHLTLAIERIVKGENISIHAKLANHLKDKKEYALATKLAEELEHTFSLPIPEAEIGYITMHLRGAKLRQDNQVLFTEDNLDTAMIARRLIREVSEQVQTDLDEDASLYQGLMAHLDPALYRLKQGMHIHNPLQEKIQQNYPDLFLTVKKALQSVLTDVEIPDEEIGFLVLHFGSSIEREGNRRTHSAVVICSSGIGSSKMISSRLQNEFPNITNVQNRSLFDLDDIANNELDLVISTIPLVDYSVDYVQVNPFLTEEDVRKIQDYIDRREHYDAVSKVPLLKTKIENHQPLKRTHSQVIKKLNELQQSLTSTIQLLKHFRIYESEAHLDLWEDISNVVAHLKTQKLVSNVNEVIASLKKRVKLSGLGIPQTELALFHARSEYVIAPIFVVHDLKQSFQLKAMDGNMINMTRVLIMLGPTEMTEEESRILSAISGIIIESEESTALFQTADSDALANFISEKLFNYYEEYFNNKGEY
ncbi:BglG family transcription antiterminator [Salipaludibacillus daqingensis]|uniref:BglG family transcription antiterminator n=1 Tax=Salipaludibacillus daqingensis TaxID=3041001 RepID=UPI0024732591|nr:BglG family transcription antiterminator [Salipaludibacillus daqingensis]